MRATRARTRSPRSCWIHMGWLMRAPAQCRPRWAARAGCALPRSRCTCRCCHASGCHRSGRSAIGRSKGPRCGCGSGTSRWASFPCTQSSARGHAVEDYFQSILTSRWTGPRSRRNTTTASALDWSQISVNCEPSHARAYHPAPLAQGLFQSFSPTPRPSVLRQYSADSAPHRRTRNSLSTPPAVDCRTRHLDQLRDAAVSRLHHFGRSIHELTELLGVGVVRVIQPVGEVG